MNVLRQNPKVTYCIIDFIGRKPTHSRDVVINECSRKISQIDGTVDSAVYKRVFKTLEDLEYIRPSMSSDGQIIFGLTLKGHSVLEHEDIDSYLEFDRQRVEREEKYKDNQIRLSSLALKTFWITFFAGVVGFILSSILGIREIILYRKQESQEQPTIQTTTPLHTDEKSDTEILEVDSTMNQSKIDSLDSSN